MGFAWNNFGILDYSDEDKDGRYLYIYNTKGDWRKISKSKYAPAIPNLKAKIETLKGKPILFRTSQNTSSWSPSEWFSDINIDKNGFKKPQEVVPFSNQEFSEGAEPAPIPHEDLLNAISELKAQMADQKKRDSEKIEDLKAKSNTDAARLAELELNNAKLISQLNEEHEALHEAAKNRNEADAEDLKKYLNIGDQHKVIVKGHPAKELTLRIGEIIPEGQTTVDLIIIKFENRNNYRVRLPQFGGAEAIASIGFNNNNRLMAKSFRSLDPDYFDKFEKSEGKPEKFFKDKVMTPEERLEIHNRVTGK